MAISESASSAAAQAESVTINFDGSYLPEDHEHGPSAAVGYTITDQGGNILVKDGYALQCFVSSTHTEFQALIAALQEARDIPGVQRVFIRGDSECVVESVCPRADHSPSADLIKSLTEKARELLDDFEYAHLTHIDRDRNEQADDLAYRGHGTRRWM